MATIPFNLIFGLFVGFVFTGCARTQLKSGAQPWRRELGLVVSFALLTVAPVATYLYLAYPDWSWMYLADPARLGKGTGLAVVVLTVLMVPAGFLLGWLLLRVGPAPRWAAKWGDPWLLLVLLLLLVGMGLVVGLLHKRLFTVGHYEDFVSGAPPMDRSARPAAQSITHGRLALALLCIWPVVLTAAGLVGWSLWGCGRWLRQQAASLSLRTGDHPTDARADREHLEPKTNLMGRSRPST